MKIRMFVSALVLSLVMALVAPNVVSAQAVPNFQHHTLSEINPDQNSGLILMNAFGERAIPTSIQTSAQIRAGNNPNELRLTTSTWLRGDFLEVSAPTVGPFYDTLENYGIGSFSQISVSEVTIGTHLGDIAYNFATPISISVASNGGIYRRPSNVTGTFLSFINGDGAIPVHSSLEIVMIPADHPDFVSDWEIYATTEWIVTTPWTAISVPTPGAAALLGLGGLLSMRRRR